MPLAPRVNAARRTADGKAAAPDAIASTTQESDNGAKVKDLYRPNRYPTPVKAALEATPPLATVIANR